VAYKVVVASGTTLNVDAFTNADLYRALKGGSSNFGIVVSFTLRTFRLGGVWGGNMIYSAASTADQQLKAFNEFVADPLYDVNAAVQMSISFSSSVGVIFVNQPIYALPQVNPPSLQRFTTIRPVLADQTSMTTLFAFANESAQSSPHGAWYVVRCSYVLFGALTSAKNKRLLAYRQMTWSLSFENDLKTLQAVFAAFNESTARVSSVADISWSITLEPLPKAFLSSSAKLGGNSLGLSDGYRGEGLVLCDSSFTWTNENDTEIVRSVGLRLLNDIRKATQQLGTDNDWVDLNHADIEQDPIRSYGFANEAFLRDVSWRYDPGQVFQRQLPGGFKIFRS
jgi:hypothetical protein